MILYTRAQLNWIFFVSANRQTNMPSIRARFNDTRFNDFFVRSLSAQHSWKDSRGHGIVAELIKSVESKYRQFIVFLLDFQSLDVSKLDGFEVYHFEVCIFHGSIVQPLRKLLRSLCVTFYFIGIERNKAEAMAVEAPRSIPVIMATESGIYYYFFWEQKMKSITFRLTDEWSGSENSPQFLLNFR